MLEPYAVKVARTVLRRGKFERTNLFQLDTHVVHAVNYERSRLALHKLGMTQVKRILSQHAKVSAPPG